MTTEIAIILLLDGIANGAIYLLAGLGLVLIFSVTRVVFVPFGDITAFCVLSIAAFELGRPPGTIWVVAIPGRHRNRHRRRRPHPFRRTGADSALTLLLWRAAADPLRAGMVRRIACGAACGADRAGSGAGAADRTLARPHRVPARRRRLGAGAADHRAGAAFRAEWAWPDVLRRRRFSHTSGGRRHLPSSVAASSFPHRCC
jgi:Branched-chain amino acid ABC-type transport system, permease components